MRISRRALRTTAPAVLVLLSGVALTACEQGPLGDHQQKAQYDTGAKAKEDRHSMPRWLPDGAKDVNYVMSTTGDDRILSFTLPGGRLPDACEAGKPQGKPRLEADWFPSDVRSGADVNCGTWSVAERGKTFYAWQDRDVARR